MAEKGGRGEVGLAFRNSGVVCVRSVTLAKGVASGRGLFREIDLVGTAQSANSVGIENCDDPLYNGLKK